MSTKCQSRVLHVKFIVQDEHLAHPFNYPYPLCCHPFGSTVVTKHFLENRLLRITCSHTQNEQVGWYNYVPQLQIVTASVKTGCLNFTSAMTILKVGGAKAWWCSHVYSSAELSYVRHEERMHGQLERSVWRIRERHAARQLYPAP